MVTYIQFPDRLVSYDTFIENIAARVVHQLQAAKDDPETVSQRRAFAIFGRANVERWRREGRVKPCKRPGKVEYRMADLRLLQQVRQDYFKR